MYEVSEAYKAAIAKNTRRYYIEGELITKSGKRIPVDNDTVYENSLYVTNQCVNGSEFEWGAVFAAEAGVQIKTETDRYEMYEAEFKFSFFLEVTAGEYEEVPMGIYTVTECSKNGEILHITSLDHMILLEEDLSEDINGYPYELLFFIAERCNVELAQEREDIEQMPNGNILMTMYASRIGTYRDAVSYIAQVLCGFAVFDRFGKLKICQYAREVCWEIKSRERYEIAVSDFKTFFRALQVGFIEDGSYHQYFRENDEMSEGLLYDMGNIPIIQGLRTTNEEAVDYIWERLQDIYYTPCETETIGNPAIDLGDLIRFIEIGKRNEEVTSLITYFDWKYRSKCKLKSAGGNPKLASTKDETQKQLINMEASVQEKDVVTHNYTNVSGYKISDTEREIVTINYAANKDVYPIFIATLQINMSEDGYFCIRYAKDLIEIDNSTNRTYLHKGDNTITVMLYLYDKQNTRHILSVFAHVEGIEENAGIAQAKILVGGIRAVLFAQGLAGGNRWDGTISFEESIGELNLHSISFNKFTEDVNVCVTAPERGDLHEAFSEISLGMIAVEKDFQGGLIFESIYKNAIINTSKKVSYIFERAYVEAEVDFRLRTSYRHTGSYTGNIASVTVDNTVFETVTEVKAE